MNKEGQEKDVIQLNPDLKRDAETVTEEVADNNGAMVEEAPQTEEAPAVNGGQEAPEGQEAPQPMHYDPNKFGYKPSEKVPFTGNLVLSMMGILNQIAIKETSVFYEPQNNFEETLATGKEVVSDLGLQAIRFMEFITQDHMDNIDQGLATPQDQLVKGQTQAKPAFTVEDVKKEE